MTKPKSKQTAEDLLYNLDDSLRVGLARLKEAQTYFTDLEKQLEHAISVHNSEVVALQENRTCVQCGLQFTLKH